MNHQQLANLIARRARATQLPGIQTMKLIGFLLLLTPGLFTGLVQAAAVDAVGITVSDADRAVEFYRDVLGFRVEADREVAGEDYERLFGVFAMRARFVRMRLGDEHIELIDYLAPEGRPNPVDGRSNDVSFQHIAIIVSDMGRAYAHLRQHKVQHASPEPQRLPDWNPNAGGIEAFYFRDPDSNHLEVLAFPPDKGAAKWHRKTKAIFLGIDHTAIVVEDTDASLSFYRDILGLTVVGGSENYGPEQARLNGVPGAHLRITALRGSGGPGVEFLEYLSPRNGRPIPTNSRPNDLWHWQIHIHVPAVDQVIEAIQQTESGRRAGTQTLDNAIGFTRAALVADRDGHTTLIGTSGADHE